MTALHAYRIHQSIKVGSFLALTPQKAFTAIRLSQMAKFFNFASFVLVLFTSSVAVAMPQGGGVGTQCTLNGDIIKFCLAYFALLSFQAQAMMYVVRISRTELYD